MKLTKRTIEGLSTTGKRYAVRDDDPHQPAAYPRIDGIDAALRALGKSLELRIA